MNPAGRFPELRFAGNAAPGTCDGLRKSIAVPPVSIVAARRRSVAGILSYKQSEILPPCTTVWRIDEFYFAARGGLASANMKIYAFSLFFRGFHLTKRETGSLFNDGATKRHGKN